MDSPPAVFKHQVQVPWYDSAEWKFVYHEIFDDDSTVDRKQNALKILNVWKVRMPRLFSGVDGTLIILSAILEDHKGFPDDIVRQVQASAVMRFLNICVVNQTKASQETLFQTARNKKLPEWLINLRHDFAHAQRIPSKDMLQRALTFSLNWLRSNYWDQQYPKITDYVHSGQMENNEKFNEFVHLYGEIVLNYGEADVKQKLGRQLQKFNVNTQGNLHSILEQIVRGQIDGRTTNSYKLCETIIANGAIFNNVLDSQDEIPAETIKLWLPMFRLLHYFNRMLSFISSLVGICCANKDQTQSRKAAMWIAAIGELLLGDRRLSVIKDEDENFDQKFTYFAAEIAYRFNPYMHIYLKTLFTAAKCNENFIDDVCEVVQALNCSDATITSETIYTLDNVREILGEDAFNGLSRISSSPGCRWEVVKDLYMFDGIPIGQSPDINYHPVLTYFKQD